MSLYFAAAVDEPSDRALFHAELSRYLESRASPLLKIPVLGGRELDLYRLYVSVQRRGGMHQVTLRQQWRMVYGDLGIPHVSTSATYNTRVKYEKILGDFEMYMRSFMGSVDQQKQKLQQQQIQQQHQQQQEHTHRAASPPLSPQDDKCQSVSSPPSTDVDAAATMNHLHNHYHHHASSGQQHSPNIGSNHPLSPASMDSPPLSKSTSSDLLLFFASPPSTFATTASAPISAAFTPVSNSYSTSSTASSPESMTSSFPSSTILSGPALPRPIRSRQDSEQDHVPLATTSLIKKTPNRTVSKRPKSSCKRIGKSGHTYENDQENDLSKPSSKRRAVESLCEISSESMSAPAPCFTSASPASHMYSPSMHASPLDLKLGEKSSDESERKRESNNSLGTLRPSYSLLTTALLALRADKSTPFYAEHSDSSAAAVGVNPIAPSTTAHADVNIASTTATASMCASAMNDNDDDDSVVEPEQSSHSSLALLDTDTYNYSDITSADSGYHGITESEDVRMEMDCVKKDVAPLEPGQTNVNATKWGLCQSNLNKAETSLLSNQNNVNQDNCNAIIQTEQSDSDAHPKKFVSLLEKFDIPYKNMIFNNFSIRSNSGNSGIISDSSMSYNSLNRNSDSNSNRNSNGDDAFELDEDQALKEQYLASVESVVRSAEASAAAHMRRVQAQSKRTARKSSFSGSGGNSGHRSSSSAAASPNPNHHSDTSEEHGFLSSPISLHSFIASDTPRSFISSSSTKKLLSTKKNMVPVPKIQEQSPVLSMLIENDHLSLEQMQHNIRILEDRMRFLVNEHKKGANVLKELKVEYPIK